MIRFCLFVTALSASFFCFVVFNAAFVERAFASTIKQLSSENLDDDVKLTIVENFETYALTHWARPLQWHAGAIAQAAQLQSLKAQWFPELKDEAYILGTMYAERTLRYAPSQGTAWYRLADYAWLGYENQTCDGLKCLELSWRFEPMTRDFNMACGRFKMMDLYAQTFEADSLEVINFIASYYYQDYHKSNAHSKSMYRQKIANCFDFLAADDLFPILQSIK